MQRLLHRLRARQGQALLETAVCLPLLMFILFGIIQAVWVTVAGQRCAVAARTDLVIKSGLGARMGEWMAEREEFIEREYLSDIPQTVALVTDPSDLKSPVSVGALSRGPMFGRFTVTDTAFSSDDGEETEAGGWLLGIATNLMGGDGTEVTFRQKTLPGVRQALGDELEVSARCWAVTGSWSLEGIPDAMGSMWGWMAESGGAEDGIGAVPDDVDRLDG